jgi:hypothetical protein
VEDKRNKHSEEQSAMERKETSGKSGLQHGMNIREIT